MWLPITTHGLVCKRHFFFVQNSMRDVKNMNLYKDCHILGNPEEGLYS